MTSEDCRALLARRFFGRKVILAMGMVAGSGRTLDMLAALGARRPLMLAEGIGTGELPVADALQWKVVGVFGAPTMMDGIRAYEAALANPSAEVVDLVERYDPDRSALVIGALFSENTALCGRPYYGARQPAWCALEDKVVIDALWDELGVARAPVEIAAADAASLRAAARRLDRGDGTVWAGDASGGWHGGSELTRWACDDDTAAALVPVFSERCERVRVMPFLEGIPCSIHGIVFPDYVVALRPVESLTLRQPALGKFRYCGCASFWDPPAADREAMRAMVKHVGAGLRDRVGFRGTFTIDGVLTADGFLPTELNPRFGAGINTLSKSLPELPLYVLHLAVCAGEDWEFRPRQLEQLILDGADRVRAGGGHSLSAGERDGTDNYNLAEVGGRYQIVADDAEAHATLTIGPSPLGTMVRLGLAPEHTPVGPSVAPRFAMALELADRELGTQFGPSELATAVR